MAGKFELYKDKAGKHRFQLKAGNGEIVLVGEAYSSKSSAMNGIKSVQKNAADMSRFQVKTSKSGKPYFVLKAGNHQVIGQSEMYSSESACQAGIESASRAATWASVEDQT